MFTGLTLQSHSVMKESQGRNSRLWRQDYLLSHTASPPARDPIAREVQQEPGLTQAQAQLAFSHSPGPPAQRVVPPFLQEDV